MTEICSPGGGEVKILVEYKRLQAHTLVGFYVFTFVHDFARGRVWWGLIELEAVVKSTVVRGYRQMHFLFHLHEV